jgi:uncharacterized Zn-finger protein
MADNEEAPEITLADGPNIACDGGGGALGHPRVFLTFDQSGRVDCPYCGRKFERQPGGPDTH